MRMTANRKRILDLLDSDRWECEIGLLPYSADSIRHVLEYDGFKQSIKQTHRTLADLLDLGLIEQRTSLSEHTGNPLPQCIKEYVLTGRLGYWLARDELRALEAKLKKHHVGSTFFGATLKDEMTAPELEQTEQRIKKLLIETKVTE